MPLVSAALLQSELPHRDPAWIYDLLRQRAETVATAAKDDLGAEGEAILLARADPLITLALARFSLDGDLVAQLFQRGGDLRTAALTNRAWHFRRQMRTLPIMLFDDHEERCAAWLSEAAEIEVLALFENPTLDDDVAARVVLGQAPYDQLPDGQRILAVCGLSNNPGLVGSVLPGGHESIGPTVRKALWQAAATVEPTTAWAMALAGVYEDLELGRRDVDDPLAIADRWGEDRPHSAAFPRLKVRMHLVRMVLAGAADRLPELLASADPAQRAAGLRWGAITPEQIQAAIERDALFATEHLAMNAQFWRTASGREALWDLCTGAGEQVSGYLRPQGFYRDAADWFRKRHLEWFEGSS